MRAHRLAPLQRLATGLDRYDQWVTLVVHEGRDGCPEPCRLANIMQPPLLSAHTAVDKQVAGKLARVQRRRQDASSPPAFTVPVAWCSRLRQAQKRDFAAPQRAAYRTQSPAFGRNDAFWCRTSVCESSLSGRPLWGAAASATPPSRRSRS